MGRQWTEFLAKRGVRESEMMDTSIGPWLKANSGNQVSKVDLVRKFDATVPEFKVDILGKQHDISPRLKEIVQRMDPQAYSPEAGGIIRFLQQGAKNLGDEKEMPKFLASADDLFEKMYGIRNVTSEGIPPTNVSVPYEIKQLMTDMLGATRRRGVGMERSAFVDTPKHASPNRFCLEDPIQGSSFSGGSRRVRVQRSRDTTTQHSFGAAKQKNAFMHLSVSRIGSMSTEISSFLWKKFSPTCTSPFRRRCGK